MFARVTVFFFLFCNCFPQFITAQNLVPNSSFEEFDTCPHFISHLNDAVPWFQPTWGSTDFYHVCSDTLLGGPLASSPQNFIGYQIPRSGAGYAGIFISIFIGDTINPYREYLEVKLNNVLQAGKKYFVSFYVSLSDSVNFATDDIGAYLSNDTIQNKFGNFLSVTPQITNPSGNFITERVEWTEISGEYLAQGGEQFLTIGNFKNDQNTDTLFVAGGSLMDPEVVYTSVYYYVDDICVAIDSLACFPHDNVTETKEAFSLFLFPNPATTSINLTLPVSKPSTISIINTLGEEVMRKKISSATSSIPLNISSLASRAYLVVVRTNEKVFTGKFVKE